MQYQCYPNQKIKLTCDCFGEKSFANSRWSNKKTPIRQPGTEGCVFARIFEEIHNIGKLFLSFIAAFDIVESYCDLLRVHRKLLKLLKQLCLFHYSKRLDISVITGCLQELTSWGGL